MPEDVCDHIIVLIIENSGLRAAKELRKYASVSQLFAQAARMHPDNNTPDVVCCVE